MISKDSAISYGGPSIGIFSESYCTNIYGIKPMNIDPRPDVNVPSNIAGLVECLKAGYAI